MERGDIEFGVRCHGGFVSVCLLGCELCARSFRFSHKMKVGSIGHCFFFILSKLKLKISSVSSLSLWSALCALCACDRSDILTLCAIPDDLAVERVAQRVRRRDEYAPAGASAT